MQLEKSKSKIALKFIGILFSLVSVLLILAILYMFPLLNETHLNNDLKLFFTSATILLVTTATISVFIWWIVFNKRWFEIGE